MTGPRKGPVPANDALPTVDLEAVLRVLAAHLAPLVVAQLGPVGGRASDELTPSEEFAARRGYSDKAFRRVCRRLGVTLYTEGNRAFVLPSEFDAAVRAGKGRRGGAKATATTDAPAPSEAAAALAVERYVANGRRR